MRGVKLFILILLIIPLLMACAGKAARKSETYYNQHKKTIGEVLKLFDALYDQQPFAAGFTDKSLSYYVMEVKTDSVRYIYNSERNRHEFRTLIQRFHYDTAKLSSLAVKAREIGCLWLSKTSFYVNGKLETITSLSFESVSSGKLFVENKYYILIFLQHPISSPSIDARIKKGEFVRINDLVYYTIGSSFR